MVEREGKEGRIEESKTRGKERAGNGEQVTLFSDLTTYTVGP